MTFDRTHAHGEKLAAWLEDAWLQRYLDHELTNQEESWFETYALDKAHLLRAIECDLDLRDGLHAWQSNQGRTSTSFTATTGTTASTTTGIHRLAGVAVAQRKSTSWFARFVMASALTSALLLGALVSRWMFPMVDDEARVSAPSRIMFDALGSAGETSQSTQSAGASRSLLIDIALPPRAQAVIAYFADRSSMALPVSSGGLVSLTGSRSALLHQSPIRIVWRLDGQQHERVLDLSAKLSHHSS